jgi:hypothetical protein
LRLSFCQTPDLPELVVKLGSINRLMIIIS